MNYRLPATLKAEIDDLEKQIHRLGQGEISDSELKARRVPFGIYEQRIRGQYMARIRCAAGIITPLQLKTVAQLAKQYGSGRLHVTTRQEIQMHDIPIEHLIPVLRELHDAGLSTRGGGGNTVRNITASWNSGIAADELFDVTPHAVELTSRMVELPGSWLLPRKFKIAFSNSAEDNSFATVNDLGFVATINNGKKGFRVFVAGGMGRSPQPGVLLHEFIDEKDVFQVAEALKRLFSRYGNRRNKHTARLRFLYNSLGRQNFLETYNRERQTLDSEKPAPFAVPLLSDTPHAPFTPEESNQSVEVEFELWKKRYCGQQKQTGLWWVKFPLSLGDIVADTAIRIADALSPIGDEGLRFTPDQNIVFRNIPENQLNTFFAIGRDCSPLWNRASVISSAVACAGASTCQLGICLSRGALNASIEELEQSHTSIDSAEGLRIHFSGCSNSCGQHGLAHIGFFGKASRKDGHAYPVYSIVAGAQIDGDNGSLLAQTLGTVPARAVPRFLAQFLAHYAERKNSYNSYQAYLDAEGYEKIKTVAAPLTEVPSYEEDSSWYRDWGSDTDFSLEGRGTGECAAGLFDLIELDLLKVRAARKMITDNKGSRGDFLNEILFYSARALLITQTGEVAQDDQVGMLFKKLFVEKGLVAAEYIDVVNLLKSDNPEQLLEYEQKIISFAQAIEALYLSLDETLQFHPKQEQREELKADLTRDFRGVACPMNFVKTKMALSQIKPGEVLCIFLDDGEPVENVPASAEAQGHTIIDKRQKDDYWEVLIRRGDN